jgi:hypothetical protein
MVTQSSTVRSRLCAVVAFAIIVGLLFLGGTSVVRADDTAPNPYDGKLHVDLVPYVWIPGITGTTRQVLSGITGPNGQPITTDPQQTFDTSVSSSSLRAKINFGFETAIVAHYGPFALYADIENANIGSSSADVRNVGRTAFTLASQGQVQSVSTILTIAPAVTLYHSRVGSVAVLVGSQTLWLSQNGNLQVTDPRGNTFSAGFSRAEHYGAVVAGFTGQVALGGKWSLPYFIDYGFSAPTSIQWLAGVKYGRTSLTWRTFQFNNNNANALLQRVNLTGAMVGYSLPLF